MNWGLFALLAGFLLPLALVIRLAAEIAFERQRRWSHPLILVLVTELLLAAVPVVALLPSAWTVTTGRAVEASALLFDFAASGWGMAKLVIGTLGVFVADVSMPRVRAQLINEPVTAEVPSRRYLARDAGVLATCLLLALAAGLVR